ncbi:MAG: DUF1015 family protein [Candidatus Muirbacterium halophilum]|nr:DUF1015 family protein [Candidatus Muirbacterium halophilum]MCK9477536.1 DUF1015 family protein [Candidatus Muirbacterium halophilum]
MIRIKPFNGVRPAKEYASKIASLPYDVMNSEEAREIAKNDPHTFLHVVKPEIDLPENINIYDEKVYKKGRENYEALKKDKRLVKDKEPSLYVYREKMGKVIQTGLVTCCHIDDYLEKNIKIHEHTRTVKEIDRMKHVDAINANAGPVFLTYRKKDTIQKIIGDFIDNNSPEYNFTTDDKVEHTFWKISDLSIINNITEQFNEIEYLYVADGHHRSAAAAKTGEKRRSNNALHTGNEEYNWFLAILFPHDDLYIMDYNRAVKDLNGFTEEEFINKVSEIFEVKKVNNAYKPETMHTFGMYINKNWYSLKASEELFDKNDVIESLDVSILYNNLLSPLLEIGDPKTDNRIDFIGGIRGLKELERIVNNGTFEVAFSMFPTKIEQLMDVADKNKVMPPKSTWFEPKLRSGLVIHELE